MTQPLTRRDLMLAAAKFGHRSDAGHHCHTISSLAFTRAEHPRHAERIRRELARQTDGLTRCVPSNDRRTSQPITGGAS